MKRTVRHRGVVDRVPAFQPGDPDSNPGGVRNFYFYPGTRCMSSVWVLPYGVLGGGPDILITIHSRGPAIVFLSSVLVQSLLLSLQASEPRAFGL